MRIKRGCALLCVLTAAVVLGGCFMNKAAQTPGIINVISREDGSGTRGAFVELLGIEEKNEAGEKVDHTTLEAQITNNTAVMMTTIAGDTNCIGYLSLGSLNDTVKALSIEGVSPSAATVRDGTYAISRPFNIVTGNDVSDVAKDFIGYILSEEGQKVVSNAGYIPLEKLSAYDGKQLTGKIVVAGSSSVTPVMEKLVESYTKLHPQITIEVQQSDSTTGVTSVMNGLCDIGMASRELTGEETDGGVKAEVIATDGIVIIVNKNNPIEDIDKETVADVFKGEITEWNQISE